MLHTLKDAFRRLFRGNGSTSEQIPLLQAEYASVPAVLEHGSSCSGADERASRSEVVPTVQSARRVAGGLR